MLTKSVIIRHMAVIWWIRRDFCFEDNPALTAAAETNEPVIPLYIEDEEQSLGENSRWWLSVVLKKWQAEIPLVYRFGDPAEVLMQVARETGAVQAFWNRCYEPDANEAQIKETLAPHLSVKTFNFSLLFEPWVLAKTYKVFTPFWKACLAHEAPPKPLPVPPRLTFYRGNLKSDRIALSPKKPHLEKLWNPGCEEAKKHLNDFNLPDYTEKRDFPFMKGTSLLSPYLHFGHISPRMIWHTVAPHEGGAAFLRQLGWREFAYHLLYHFPATPVKPLHPKFAHFPWRDDPEGLKAWQEGRTGYPIVDAGMRQLLETGWMHNRVRMIVGSFLVKDLLLSWQAGADWFWEKLVDADLANNTLGWQWVAGCGADAAPFFRIFNPTLQGEKFDPEGVYVRTFVKELENVPAPYIHRPWEINAYIKPVVDHKFARERALKALRST